VEKKGCHTTSNPVARGLGNEAPRSVPKNIIRYVLGPIAKTDINPRYYAYNRNVASILPFHEAFRFRADLSTLYDPGSKRMAFAPARGKASTESKRDCRL
jgi:hypothetical protein